MTAILRVKAKWTGFSGAPGYTVLHFHDFNGSTDPGADPNAAQAGSAGVRTYDFFNAIKGLIPANTRVNIEPEVEVLEDTTGELLGSFPSTVVATVAGTAAGAYMGPTGAVINWRTNSIRNGRRIRGRTFLVPLGAAAFGAEGILPPTSLATLQTAANTLAATTGSPDLGVYSRPSAAGAADGRWAVVASASVPNKASVLRSRRD